MTPALVEPASAETEGDANFGVLFVTRKWPPAVGGMETYGVELTKALRRQLPMQIIALPGQPNGNPPTATSLVAFALRVAATYLRLAEKPAILHIGDLASWPLGLLAWVKRDRPAVILSAHGTDVSFQRRKSLKGRLYRQYLRLGALLLRNAQLIANSGATAAAAAETGWRTSSIIPLATDIDRPPPSGRHDGNLLFAGRLVERKGCLWFVRNVLPLLPTHIRLNVAGPIWDESERAILDDPRVNYLGPLGREALCDAYRGALCVVVPNIDPPSGEFEGFGLVAPEAAAAGGLVIAAATGGLTDAVLHGETGLLVPPADAAEWASRINEVGSWSRQERQHFLTQSWRRSREVFAWSRVATKVIEVYCQAARATPARQRLDRQATC